MKNIKRKVKGVRMIIKATGTIGGISMNKGMVKLTLIIPTVDLPAAVSSLQLAGSTFTILLVSNGKKYKMKNVMFGVLKVDSDLESKITILVDPDDTAGITFVELAELKKQAVDIGIKGGNVNDKNGADKTDN